VTDVADLYQEIVMDHRRNPRNHGLPESQTHGANGFNPFCGDKVTVGLCVNGDVIADAGFEGDGCAISMASASLMTDSVIGKSKTDASALFESFRALLTDTGTPDGGGPDLGDLEALAGVKAYPTRIKCAILSWHTFMAALENDEAPVTTE
jgi:nitrogen fixation protein NifU and related proteins